MTTPEKEIMGEKKGVENATVILLKAFHILQHRTRYWWFMQ